MGQEKDTTKGTGYLFPYWEVSKEEKKCEEIFIHPLPHFMNTFCMPVAVPGAPDKEVIQGMVLELVVSVSNQGRWLDKQY